MNTREGAVIHHKDKPTYYGDLGEFIAPEDWQFAGALKLPKAESTYYENKITYHQNDVSTVSCTVISSMGALSDLTSHEFGLDERRTAWDLAKTRGAQEGVGWYGYKAVDLVRSFWNDRNERKVSSRYVKLLDDEFDYVLDQGYSILTGFRGNQAYITDKNDGVLDGTVFTNRTYGHFVRIVRHDKDMYGLVVDNYPKTAPSNTYAIVSRDQLKQLVANNVFYATGYFFYFTAEYEALNSPQKISPWAIKSMYWAKEEGIYDDLSNPQDIVYDANKQGNATVAYALKKAGLTSELQLQLTKEELAHVLYRAIELKI